MRLTVAVGKAVQIFQADFGHGFGAAMILSKLLLLSSGADSSSSPGNWIVTDTRLLESPYSNWTAFAPRFIANVITPGSQSKLTTTVWAPKDTNFGVDTGWHDSH